MLRIVMYGPDAEENRQIRAVLEDLIWSMQLKPVFHEFTEEREPFLTFVQRNPYLVMLIVQSGEDGLETARMAKEANSEARLVWFSKEDYALASYELRLTFFGLLPIDRKKAVSALRACWWERQFPPVPFTLV
ncbi:MAG: hypothetical protein HDT16_13725 [Oscillibacter sp.]|nr:hypothetical protein [Oscillibacter sp.]